MLKHNKIPKRILWIVITVFVFMNIIVYFHASKFTHFENSTIVKTKDAHHLSMGQKIKILFLGIRNPRPENKITPNRVFETIRLKSNKKIECWFIKAISPKGTVVLFHGYSGEKSSMLDKAEVFLQLDYNTMLVDFMGSGGSEGNQTTLGFYEAEEVRTVFEYLKKQDKKKRENNFVYPFFQVCSTFLS